jgi:hypothetical protein
VPGKKGEALGLFRKQHGCEVAVTEPHFAVLGHRAGDAEGLQPLAQGAGMGLMSILRPLLIADILGRSGFGSISGAVAVSPILASAAAPALGALLLAIGGTGLVYASCLAMAVSGWVIAAALLRGR